MGTTVPQLANVVAAPVPQDWGTCCEAVADAAEASAAPLAPGVSSQESASFNASWWF